MLPSRPEYSVPVVQQVADSVLKVSYHPDLRNTMYLLCSKCSAEAEVSILCKSSNTIVPVLDVQDPDKPETWKFQNLMSWKGPPYPEDLKDPVERIRFFKSRGAQFTDPWRTAALGVSDDTIVSVDPGGYLEPPEGIEQHSIVTLAGDAAHTMLPRRLHVSNLLASTHSRLCRSRSRTE